MTGETARFDVAYLGMWPVHRSDGLNVLLSDTIKPLSRDGVEVVVHTTDRHQLAVRGALESNGVDLGRVRVEVHRVGSLGLKWIRRLRGGGRVEVRKPEAQAAAAAARPPSGARLFVWAADMTAASAVYKLPVFVLLAAMAFVAGLFALLVAVLGAVVALPLLALLALAWLASRRLPGVVAYLKTRTGPSGQRLRKARAAARRCIATGRRWLAFPGTELYRLEQERFAASLQRRTRSLVFFFSAFEGHAVRKLRNRKVVVFPDAVTSVFPTRFPGFHARDKLDAVRMAVQHADGLVCYSEFVRDTQLLRLFRDVVGTKPVRVIPQGYFLPAQRQRPRTEVHAELQQERWRIVNNFPALLRRPPVVQFGEFDLVLYPTVDRQHKNTTTLVRAVEHLIRRRHRNVKLLLTTPSPTPDVRDLVHRSRLQYDVLFMPSVPLRTLELLFEGAALMVHPSLAEGGDVFNFSRAASVGVPSLMADVAVVREMFEREDMGREVYGDWLFPPADWQQLAERMEAALDNRDALAAAQGATLAKLARHDFGRMARMYFDFCREVASP